MSILQEYEQIKKQIGKKEYNAMEQYLTLHTNILLSDLFYNEKKYNDFKTWYKMEVQNND